MDKILSILASVGVDKYLHFIAGLIISASFCIVLGMGACVVPAIIVAFAKEFADGWRYGGCDWCDFTATVLGGAVIQMFSVIAAFL